MKILFLTVFFVFLACKESEKKETVVFEDSKTFRLAAPHITVDSLLFINSATIKADFNVDNAEIKYTINGDSVTASSTLYNGPIKVNSSSTLNFKAFHPDYQSSEMVSAQVVQLSKSTVSTSIASTFEPHENYAGNGIASLVDLKKGVLNFRGDTNWLGFNTASISFALKFSEPRQVSKIVLSTLENHGAWIFNPIKIIASNKSKKLGELELDVPTAVKSTVNTFLEVPINEGKYSEIKLQIELLDEIPQWHQGKGTIPFFFIDEIIVE